MPQSFEAVKIIGFPRENHLIRSARMEAFEAKMSKGLQAGQQTRRFTRVLRLLNHACWPRYNVGSGPKYVFEICAVLFGGSHPFQSFAGW